ncbi:MAG: hypothetical protein QOD99_1109 [Chthoniobacter sp.]|jgi:hypothetical protein|nr:hypothetical protein [Chthoniobacter sp.]
MKTHLLLTVSFAVALLAPALRAETVNERDFNLARAEREKAAAVAMEPINRRYKETLEKLFKRATQDAELDLAKTIQAQLHAVGGPAAVANAGAPVDASSSVSSTGDKTDLRKLIENTRWVREGKDNVSINFLRSGNMKAVGAHLADPGWSYSLEAPDIVKLELKGARPAEKRFLTFRVDVSQMTMTQDSAMSSSPGSMVLKYVGPAPKK